MAKVEVKKETRSSSHNYFITAFFQIFALIKMRLFMMKHGWISTVGLVFTPILVSVGFSLFLGNGITSSQSVKPIRFKTCDKFFFGETKDKCISIGYTASTNVYLDEIRKILKSENYLNRNDLNELDEVGEIDSVFDLVQFQTVEDMEEFNKEHPETLMLGINILLNGDTEEVTVFKDRSSSPRIHENVLAAAKLCDEAICGDDIVFEDISVAILNDTSLKTAEENEQISIWLLINFLMFIYMKGFLGRVAEEREKKLTIQMEIIGLKKLARYLSISIMEPLLLFFSSSIVYLVCFLFGQPAVCKFSYLFFVPVTVIAFFSIQIIFFAVFSFIPNTRFINAFYITTVILGMIRNGVYDMGADIIDWPIYLRILLAIPQANPAYYVGQIFSNAMKIMKINIENDPTIEGTKIGFEILGDVLNKDFPIQFYLVILLCSIPIAFVLATFASYTMPWNHGRTFPIWFFALPSYWGFGGSEAKDFAVLDSRVQDVINEAQSAAVDDPSHFRILGLEKSYMTFGIPSWLGGSKNTAVKCLSTYAAEGQLYALLGHNGAGKTSAMNVITGLSGWDKGDVYMDGKSLKGNPDYFNSRLGVCPQHDILFDDLSPNEHIDIYGSLKMLGHSQIHEAKTKLLEAFRLSKVSNKSCKKFSGGMKRRLSLLIALLGDPRILIMDEPTTGMDPLNRRYVWDFVANFKKNRIVFLTTHSMEEADVLGDKIAIMKDGNICAIGTSLHLKTSLASGYRFSVVAHSWEMEGQMVGLILNRLPFAYVESASMGSVKFIIPASHLRDLFQFCTVIDTDLQLKEFVKEWGLSQMTLEDVFHALSHDHYSDLQ